MSTRSRFPIIGATGLLLVALPAIAQKTHKAKPIATDIAIIQNTGSTKKMSYTIEVQSSGKYRVKGEVTRVAAAAPPRPILAPLKQTRQLFHDLKRAMPLSKLSGDHGTNRGSFDARIYVYFRGQRSPALTYDGAGLASALRNDVYVLTLSLGVIDYDRIPAIGTRTP